MENNIKGKNILLLCENFYDYDKVLERELYHLGAKKVFLKKAEFFCCSLKEVDWHHPKGILKYPFEQKIWTRNFEKEISNLHFDLFICIENACFSKDFMAFLHARNPGIKTVLFLWDTYKTQQGGYKDYRFLFDKVFSFDRDDARMYGMEYFPDFYIPQKRSNQYEYDLSFVGTANGTATIHRFKLMDYVSRFCEDNNLSSFLYLKTFNQASHNPLRQAMRRFLGESEFEKLIDEYKNREWLHFDKLPLEKCNQVQAKARVLLDLNHRNRQGMTINCITALAHGQKLITTNKRIAEEPFYSPNMIYIMDEDNPQLDVTFWNRSNEMVNLEYLRIDNWLKHITDF